MKYLITGATGLVGRALVARLGSAVVVSRDSERARARLPGVEVYAWAPEAEPLPIEALRGVQAIIHLGGEPVADGRWTPERKKSIRDSRVQGTRHLVAGLAAAGERPRVLVSASAVGYYGDRGDERLDETSGPGEGFLSEVCTAWESEAMEALTLGLRVVRVRIGVVLARDGGALSRMLPAFRLGAGGRLGTGRQWMPWVHLSDLVSLLVHAAEDERIQGPMNAVAPEPVTNAAFARALGQALHRPALLPAPALALRLAFGEMSQVLLGSQRVVPKVAEATGYVFNYPTLDLALASLLGPMQADPTHNKPGRQGDE